VPVARQVGRGDLRDRPALAHPNVELLTGALVSRLETSASGGEITGVIVERRGETQRFSPMSSWLSAGAINSAALLFAAFGNDRHPRGLANRSDVVGATTWGTSTR